MFNSFCRRLFYSPFICLWPISLHKVSCSEYMWLCGDGGHTALPLYCTEWTMNTYKTICDFVIWCLLAAANLSLDKKFKKNPFSITHFDFHRYVAAIPSDSVAMQINEWNNTILSMLLQQRTREKWNGGMKRHFTITGNHYLFVCIYVSNKLQNHSFQYRWKRFRCDAQKIFVKYSFLVHTCIVSDRKTRNRKGRERPTRHFTCNRSERVFAVVVAISSSFRATVKHKIT